MEKPRSRWFPASEKPPLHQSVLIRHRGGVGEAYDVACYAGRQPDGEERWIMADIRLESKQITHWHPLPEPPEGLEP